MKATTAADSAKAIRAELKKTFPKIKFKVTSKSYSGGSSVSIRYEDGVLTKDVEEVVKKYEYGSFDGMTDCYKYDNQISNLPQVKYVMVSRDMSDKVEADFIKELRDTYAGHEGLTAENFNFFHADGWDVQATVLVRRLFSERTY